MVKPILNPNTEFRYQVETLLKETFHSSTQSAIKYVTKKDNTCIIELMMFYGTRKKNPMKVLRLLSCVVYSAI